MAYHEHYRSIVIKNKSCLKTIHVSSETVVNGTRVHLWEENPSTENEVWEIQPIKKINDHVFIVYFVNRDKFLNVKGGHAEIGRAHV